MPKPYRNVWLYRDAAQVASRLSKMSGISVTKLVNDAVLERGRQIEPEFRRLFASRVPCEGHPEQPQNPTESTPVPQA